MKVAVIGGGAAGFFGAIAIKETNPDAEVYLFEKSDRILSKVKISGGGRCNVTNATFDVKELVKYYPRGSRELISVFTRFGPQDTIDWFESRDVKLKIEPDNRVFPVSDNSQTVIDCLLKEAEEKNIHIKKNYSIEELIKEETGFCICFKNNEKFFCDKILIAPGGNSKPEAYEWIKKHSHTIIKPVPSLFTFVLSENIFSGLEGISVPEVEIKLKDEKIPAQRGSILITHGGLSGFGVLKFSAFAARTLSEKNYKFTLSVNWLPDFNGEHLYNKLLELKKSEPNKILASVSYFRLPMRLWKRLLELSGIGADKKFNELSNQRIKNFVNELTEHKIIINEKNTNKEEFVTAGGVSLKDINFKTMESKKCPGIYFAGEVLDIDGVTGGFNFQSAWSTGWIAGKNIGSILKN
ncbi:MAG TPA: NAD(P)/FAD-dependent oxidoreductase [Ignavibacteria bacterium]